MAKRSTARRKTTKKASAKAGRKKRSAPMRVTASVENVADRARDVGKRVAEIVQDAPELIQAVRNDRALRSELDDQFRAIGKRVVSLHKRARGEEGPFAHLKGISKQIDEYALLEAEYRSNRVRLSRLRAEMRGRS